ncbi:hypothetical protein [Phenylobacterium sp.]|uniref:hypothetical protein n=1 Tax=Phenylobacterium sp. TaxID=1871053 RepID=UPI0025DB60A8|nr:hypothetical protein [Phenylobacterium sp.]
MKRKAVALVGLLVAGCSHGLLLTPQDGVGPVGRGSAPTSMGYSGKMTVDLAGKHYVGDWTLQSTGGGVGIGTAFSGGTVASGSFVGLSANGNGRAYLTEAGGASLACQFTYNEMSATGIGVCRSSVDGKLYDLAIQ